MEKPTVPVRHDTWTATLSGNKELPIGNVNMSVLETVVT